MKKRSLKIGLIVLLVMLMLGLTYTSFAYWDNLTKNDDVIVNIGEGKEIFVTTALEPEDGKFLIPAGTIAGPNDVDSLTAQFTVTLDNEVNTPLNLSVDVTEVLIGTADTYVDLIDVDIILSANTIQNDADVTVDITIKLIEPEIGLANITNAAELEAAYAAIINKAVNITLEFKAVQ